MRLDPALPGRRRKLEVKAVDRDPAITLRAALDSLGVWVVVEKATSPGGLEVERDRVEELRQALGVDGEQLVAHGYAHLQTCAGSVITRP